MATLKQTIANRLNALRSTGPRSDGGKARSSRNALRHGLSRLGAVPPEGMADAIADRKERWRPSYRPEGPAQDWQFERLCAESVRLDSCERRLLALRAERAERAAESWDDDRAALVAERASTLPARPEVVQPRLLQSRHGVLWLIGRWDEVADSLRRAQGWTPETWDLAMDLLGLPRSSRAGSGPWDLHPEDPGPGPGLELVRDAVEPLRRRLDTHLDARDARARADAESGLADPADSPDLRLLERYAADARRQVARCSAELRRLQALDANASATTPAPNPSPNAAPSPSGPPGPRPDRTSRSNPSVAAPRPAEAPPAPIAARSASNPAPAARPGPTRSPIPTASTRDPMPGGDGVSLNRRARRALAAASRRS
ncbi:hypothetical protein [Tautonia plasticadhaerens]|uniref:Uncharacterized protein n=1 Tax=Tautonia plasticadhaerens TaxID=2527974 RepID=A0A518H011_9BACT|nr:hypothetical protein [Tautonia plasticadhaerens]QDV34176.1 hypothetical protein ElP_20600 [Tautonia plasticadhaerens]